MQLPNAFFPFFFFTKFSITLNLRYYTAKAATLVNGTSLSWKRATFAVAHAENLSRPTVNSEHQTTSPSSSRTFNSSHIISTILLQTAISRGFFVALLPPRARQALTDISALHRAAAPLLRPSALDLACQTKSSILHHCSHMTVPSGEAAYLGRTRSIPINRFTLDRNYFAGTWTG